jgi:hypothetical protein
MTALPETCNHNGQPLVTSGLRAAKAVCRDRGESCCTLWRRRKLGLIKCVNIFGKVYVDLQSLAEFDRRAAAGEFAKPPHGAAGASARERAAREGGEQ